MLAALEASGRQDVVVALWADHGWSLGDNNEWYACLRLQTQSSKRSFGHSLTHSLARRGKHTAYYRTNHVPMIFVPSFGGSLGGPGPGSAGGPSREYAELTDLVSGLVQIRTNSHFYFYLSSHHIIYKTHNTLFVHHNIFPYWGLFLQND